MYACATAGDDELPSAARAGVMPVAPGDPANAIVEPFAHGAGG
jgi:hypothetical protein